MYQITDEMLDKKEQELRDAYSIAHRAVVDGTTEAKRWNGLFRLFGYREVPSFIADEYHAFLRDHNIDMIHAARLRKEIKKFQDFKNMLDAITVV